FKPICRRRDNPPFEGRRERSRPPLPFSALDTIGIREAISHPGGALDGSVRGLHAAAGEFPAARTARSADCPAERRARLLLLYGRPECRRLSGERRGGQRTGNLALGLRSPGAALFRSRCAAPEVRHGLRHPGTYAARDRAGDADLHHQRQIAGSPALREERRAALRPRRSAGDAARGRHQHGGHRSRPGVGFQGRWRQARVHPLPRRVHGVRRAAARDSLRRRLHLRGQFGAGQAAAGRCVPRPGRALGEWRGATQSAGVRAVRRGAGVRVVSGTAVLSLLVCALCGAGLAYPLVFLAIGFLAIGGAVVAGSGWGRTKPRVQGDPRGQGGPPHCSATSIVFGIAFGMFVVLYLANAMAPEISPDGATYHLGLVSRYLREHGFVRITDNLYAAMPEGVEMLFLFAFAFGKHSAAALVHLVFFVALGWQVFSYARRRGFPVAGASAALVVFASPVAGIDGTSAYNDVAVAAIAFTLFHLLQIWDEERQAGYPLGPPGAPNNWRLVAAIGLVAGFAFAAKYTAWPAVAYAVAFVVVKNRRAVLPVAASALAVIAPWLLKNWIYLH